MKLANYIRDAFIESVMHDVPRVNYEDQIAQILDTDVINQLPPLIKRVYESAELRGYLDVRNGYHYVGNQHVHHIVIGDFAPREEAITRAEALMEKQIESETQLDGLRRKLHSIAYGCKTRQELLQALPEFARYLPVPAKSENLQPLVVVDVVNDFVKAGWPKAM